MKPISPLVVCWTSLSILFALPATAQAPASKFPLTCGAAPPDDCAEFQDYWDHTTISNHYNCPMPRQAKQCWPSNAYVLKGCNQSPLGLDFIAAHDATSAIFRKAYANGDFNSAPNLVHAWEDLNASLMDLLYPVQNKQAILDDISKLKLPDAVAFGTIAARHTTDFNQWLRVMSPIAINLLACTDIEKRVPGFMRTALSKVMLIGGVWFVEAPQGEAVSDALIYDGPVDLRLSVARDDCAGPAIRPTILVEGVDSRGKSFSQKLDFGGPAAEVAGKKITIRLIRGPKDWTRYQCAAGRLSIR